MDREREPSTYLPKVKFISEHNRSGHTNILRGKGLIIYIYQSFLEVQIPYRERKIILEFWLPFMLPKPLPVQQQLSPAYSPYSNFSCLSPFAFFFLPPFLLRVIHPVVYIYCCISEFL